MSVVSAFHVRRFQDPSAFLQKAGPWLQQSETEHNLILGIANQLAAGTLLSQKPVYLATVEQDAAVVGCAFRTPPYKLGVTRLPAEAVSVLVDDVAHVYDAIPAVMGEHATAGAVAEEWARRKNMRAVPGMEHRIYELDHVTPPPHAAEGMPRTATAADTAGVAAWIEAFSSEAGLHVDNAHGLAAARIKYNALYLWEHNNASVSMAAWSGETPRGRRVGYVYTPPEHRRKGYATALVAHVSEQILADGCAFCFLYTDLANPTSNDIYQQIGYRPVCDVTDWNLIPAPEAQ